MDGGLGEAAGLGDVGLLLAVAGDDGCCLDKGLGLEGLSFFILVENTSSEAFNTLGAFF